MANRTAADYETEFLDNLQINTTTDPPISTVASAGSFAAAKTSYWLNDALASMWELESGRVVKATSATMWATAQSSDTSGTVLGALTTASEVLHVWATTASTSTGGQLGDVELDKVDMATILMHRNIYGSSQPYLTPVEYCIVEVQAAADADVGKARIEYWPGLSGFYLPAWYIPHFTALSATTSVADISDIGQRDLPLFAAYNAAPTIDRADLQPTLFQRFSDRMKQWMNRRLSAKQDARADDSER